MYAPHWSALPNLGMDILSRLILSVTSPHVGGRLLLALSLIAPLAGATLYAKAAFGRWTWWSLGSGAIAFNGIFFLGFMNFLLGIGVALAGAAAWRIWREEDRLATPALGGAAISLAAYFCHLFGFAYFAVLVITYEVDAFRLSKRDGVQNWRRAGSAAAALGLALVPTFALFLTTHRPVGGGDRLVWMWQAKSLGWLAPFMAYENSLTMFTAVVVGSVVILVWRDAERASGALLGFMVLSGLYLTAPSNAAGGAFVDVRFPLMAALLLFAGLVPRLSLRTARAIGVIFALLMLGRSAEVAVNWRGRARVSPTSELAWPMLSRARSFCPSGPPTPPANLQEAVESCRISSPPSTRTSARLRSSSGRPFGPWYSPTPLSSRWF